MLSRILSGDRLGFLNPSAFPALSAIDAPAEPFEIRTNDVP
jgi:hypothetical protein